IAAFQYWVTCWPDEKVQPTVQPLMGSPRFRTITVAPNPPGHWASFVYWTEHPVAADAGSAANATVAAAAVRTAMPAATAGGRLSMSRPFPDPMPDGGRRC